jgi:hypothetical protein
MNFNTFLAERIWGGRDSSLDTDDCAESRAQRFAPFNPEELPPNPTPSSSGPIWAAARLAEWLALRISTSTKEAVCAPATVNGAIVMNGGAPLANTLRDKPLPI